MKSLLPIKESSPRQNSRITFSALVKNLQKAEDVITDLIFPSACIRCEKPGVFLCDACLKEIPLQSFQVCPICERAITIGGKLCNLCKKEPHSIDQLVVASDYKNKDLAKAIHFFKYKFVCDFSVPLGKILLEALLKNNLPVPDLIVPVPLNAYRLRWRGFNQSEMLARYVGKNLIPPLEIHVENNLIFRKRNTPAQMKIKNFQKRQENIKNAFALNSNYPKEKIRGKKILIVDDICTTGATIFECAREIKTLNPRSISAVVLARQS